MADPSGKGSKRRKDQQGLDHLAERLRTVRKQKLMTQEDLAGQSGISLSQVGRIERGEINPTVSTIFELARALDIEVSELFTFKLDKRKR